MPTELPKRCSAEAVRRRYTHIDAEGEAGDVAMRLMTVANP